MFKKSLMLAALTAVLSFSTVLPATQAFAAKPTTATATETKDTTEKVEATETIVTDGQVEASGKWGWLVRGALAVIKGAIKYGGEALEYVVKWLDADTAKYLSNNTTKIASGIDNAIAKFDELGEYATGTIRTIVLDGLRLAGVPDTYGVGIADAIAMTVDWLLL
ncbi:hypothetical protein [Paenibacillus durus]|uniref:hypothetical protein n=1 Tax=Paenibacillus durus TaxID=44251 RepID=UPI0006937865|nr:hypothetical protein [Paenibacillus durus]